MISDILWFALVALWLALFCCEELLAAAFRRTIRVSYPSAWAQLGAPRVLRDWLVLHRYLWNDDYRLLVDPALERLATWLKSAQIAYLVAFGTVIVATALRG